MIKVYKNNKLVVKGENIAYVYLNSEDEVIAKSPCGVEVAGADRVISPVKDNTFNELVPKCQGPKMSYYHKLSSGSGKNISDYEKVWDLDSIKSAKCEEIDLKTSELIANGISFDDSIFSTSSEAQRNWIALFSARDMMNYPVYVTTLDDKEYAFDDSNSVANFYLTGIGTVNAHIFSGRSLKIQVNNCTTKDDVDAIEDSR